MLKKSIIIASILLAFAFFSSLSFAAVDCRDSCFSGENNCECQVTNCDSGIFDIYSSSTCLGDPIIENAFVGGRFTWSPSRTGTFYTKALCDDLITQTGCDSISVKSGSETATTVKVTTTKEKPTCQSQCCPIDDPTYAYKPCSGSDVCTNRKCVSKGGDNTGLIIGIIIIIIIIAVVIYFFFIRKKSGTQTRGFEELYRKWR